MSGRSRKKVPQVRKDSPPARPFLEKWPGLSAGVILAALTTVVYSNSFSAGFVLDNKGLLLQDPRIRDLTWDNIRLILQHTYWWPTGESGLYRPLTTLSYLFNYAFLGNANSPAGYHWVNFLLHLGNVFLVYALLRKLLREVWPAFFATALWAVHPVLTESVTNMIGRSDLLSGMGVLAGFLAYLKSTETRGTRRMAWLGGLMAATALAVFSKESGVTLLGIIVVYELVWRKERRQARAMIYGGIAALVPISVMLIQRWRVLAASPPAEFPCIDNPIACAGFLTGRLTALRIIPRYLWLTVCPFRLASDYSYAQIPLARGTWQDWAVCALALTLGLLVVGLYWWNRTAFFFASFAAIAFAPTSNLVVPIGAIMAERFLYIPSIGLLAGLVMLVGYAGKSVAWKQLAPAVLGVLVVVFSVRTWVRNGDWQNELTMAEACVRDSPNSYKGHLLLGYVLDAARAPGSDPSAIVSQGDRAVAILDPLPDAQNSPDAYRSAGGWHLAMGDYLHAGDAPASRREYGRAVQLIQRSLAIAQAHREDYDRKGGAKWARNHPDSPVYVRGDADSPWMLAAAYWRLGESQEAAGAADRAIALLPSSGDAYRQIAFAFGSDNRFDDAAVALIQGGLITGDARLRGDLLDLYHDRFEGSCALTPGPNGPTLDIQCGLVRKHLCAASVGVIKAFVQDKRLDDAQRRKQDFIHKYGCPAGPLDQVLPE